MKRFLSVCLSVVILLSVVSLVFAESVFPLHQGSKGKEVKELQTYLSDLKYLTGKADGNFGEKTRSAVEKYQADYEFDVTGTVNEDLLQHIKNRAIKEFDPSVYSEDAGYIMEDGEWSWIGQNASYMLPMIESENMSKYYEGDGTVIASVLMYGTKTNRPEVWLDISYLTSQDFDFEFFAIKLDDTIYGMRVLNELSTTKTNSNGNVYNTLIPMGETGISMIREIASMYQNGQTDKIIVVLASMDGDKHTMDLEDNGLESGFLLDINSFDAKWEQAHGINFDFSDIDKEYEIDIA